MAEHSAVDDPARAYWLLWRRGGVPDLDRFLAGVGPLDPLQLAAVLRVDQREQWGLGASPRAADYLRRFPRLNLDPEAPLELIYAEWLLREELGEAPVLDDFRRSYPEHATGLAIQVELHQALRADHPFGSLDAEPNSTLVCSPRPGDPPRPAAKPLPAIPGYEMLGELGHGGMGVVYKAREVRLDRVVALKMILAGDLAGPETLIRFFNEAQVLARLKHPHIVQIHAIGEYEHHPYLVLEYLDGGSLDRALTGQPWPARRAALLLEVLARAMAEAHRLGVVHRDLKPANVLLTGDGSPKITDFGLAKCLALDSGLTGPQAIIGTPSYMAPEQALGKMRAIGPPTDVHALGAILYELLTGRPPFLAEGPLETLEKVRACEPIPPSRLGPKIPRDLETICLKCLSKEPARRYPDAAALGDDLRRFLGGLSIRARPAGPVERLGRWCRREPVLAGLGAALGIALTVGVAGVTTQWLRAESHLVEVSRQRGLAMENLKSAIGANRQLQEANRHERAARDQSQKRFGLALDLIDDLTAKVGDRDLVTDPRLAPLRLEWLARARDFFARLQQSLAEDDAPSSRIALARAYARLGVISREIGSKEDAIASFRRALAIHEALDTAHSGSAAMREELAKCYLSLGGAQRELQQAREALASYQASLDLLDALVRERPADERLRSQLTWSLGNVGVMLNALGRHQDALHCHQRVLKVREGLLREHPNDDRRQSDVAWCRIDLAFTYESAGDRQSALGSMKRAVVELEAIRRRAPDEPDFQSRAASSEYDYGLLLARIGRAREAIPIHQRALATFERLARAHPLRFGLFVARSQSELSQAFSKIGDRPSAIAHLERAAETLRGLLVVNPADSAAERDLASDLVSLSVLYINAGRPEDAPTILREARSIREKLAKADPDDEEARRLLVSCACHLACGLARVGRTAEALNEAPRIEELCASSQPSSVRRTLYNLACLFALCQANSPGPHDLGDRAMDALRRASQAGFHDLKSLRSDPDLDSLRGRPEFQLLLDQPFPALPFAGDPPRPETP